MISEVESFNESIAETFRDELIYDVTKALSGVQTQTGKFIINDTLWYWRNPAGDVRPTVVNSAHFISKKFQNEMEALGWKKEPTIAGQTFDAMKTVARNVPCYKLSEHDFIPTLTSLRARGLKSYGHSASTIYRDYVESSSPFLPVDLLPYIDLFNTENRDYKFRVGVEFETGNIASSFRAIGKLQGLYDRNEIDIGVFVTSKNKKDGAARIWPISNRNGSFEELRQRRYDEQRRYPHIDISFLPDGISATGSYLGTSSLYEMKFTGETVKIDGITYRVALNPKNEEKLLPVRTTMLP